MALAYSANIQNAIALRVARQTYTNLASVDKTLLDGNWSSGDPGSGSIAGGVLTMLRQYANFVEMTGQGSGDGPDAWVEWLTAETVARASPTMSTDATRPASFRAIAQDAARVALTAYSREDTDTTSGTEGLAYTRQSIRRMVLARCIALNPMLLARPEQIDHCIREAVARVWSLKNWSWRHVSDTITIPNSSTTNPTVTYGSTNTPDSIATRKLYFSSPSDVAGQFVTWANEDTIQQFIAQGLDAGQPRYFNTFSAAAGGLTWFIDRGTDQEYVLRGAVLAKLPSLATNTGVDTALTAMPDDFKSVVANLAIGATMIGHGRREGYGIQADAQNKLEELIVNDDPGQPNTENTTPDGPATIAGYINPTWPGGMMIGGQL